MLQYRNDIIEYQLDIKAKTGRGLRNIFQLLLYQTLVFKWLLSNRNKYDVIHVFDFDAGLPVMIVCKFARKKYVYHIADFYVDSRMGIPSLIKNIIKKLEFLVISNAETTIVCTEDRVKQIEGSNPKKLVVIHNAPSLSPSVRPTNTFSEDKLIFTYVGSLSERRFVKHAIQIFKNLPEFQLNIAGMGNLAEYVEEEAKKAKNIKYFGKVDYNTALDMYAHSNVMFAIYDPRVPNHKFSAPNKVYEAMFLGKPIIVAKGTGVDKIVKQNEMGFVIDFSENGFIGVLEQIKNNPTILEQYGENARKAYPRYSWPIMKKRLVNVYEELNY